jgi:hypothetical protein
MPSSSSHNTYLERNLTEYIRVVHTHLRVTGVGGQPLRYCALGSANTLDLSVFDVVHRVCAFEPLPHFPETYEAAAIMHSIADRSKAMRVYERFFEASAVCGEMGALLIEHRRAGEGQFWCNWADEFHGEAVAAKGREVAFAKACEREKMLVEKVDKRRDRPVEADVHVQMAIAEEAKRRQRLISVGEHMDDMPTMSKKEGKMPMMSNRHEMPMPMRPNKHGKRPMEADEDVGRDQAVKRANIEHMKHVVARVREQLNGRASGQLSLIDQTHGNLKL